MKKQVKKAEKPTPAPAELPAPAPKPMCNICGRKFKSPLAVAIHCGQKHKPTADVPAPPPPPAPGGEYIVISRCPSMDAAIEAMVMLLAHGWPTEVRPSIN
jgi:hypothetical protein